MREYTPQQYSDFYNSFEGRELPDDFQMLDNLLGNENDASKIDWKIVARLFTKISWGSNLPNLSHFRQFAISLVCELLPEDLPINDYPNPYGLLLSGHSDLNLITAMIVISFCIRDYIDRGNPYFGELPAYIAKEYIDKSEAPSQLKQKANVFFTEIIGYFRSRNPLNQPE